MVSVLSPLTAYTGTYPTLPAVLTAEEPQSVYRQSDGLTNNPLSGTVLYIVKKGTKLTNPISKSGFLLGATLALIAAIIKVRLLPE